MEEVHLLSVEHSIVIRKRLFGFNNHLLKDLCEEIMNSELKTDDQNFYFPNQNISEVIYSALNNWKEKFTV